MRAPRAFILVIATASLACSSAPPVEEPEVTQRGTYRIWYTGPDLEAELDCRWAALHLGDEFLILKLSIAGGHGAANPVARDAITIRSPDDHRVALLSPTEFRRVAGRLRTALDRTNAWAPPSYRFAGSRHPCGDWFLVPAGAGFASPTVWVSPMRYCTGPLVFQIPGGVQPGRWVLTIELVESTVRIPFVLGE